MLGIFSKVTIFRPETLYWGTWTSASLLVYTFCECFSNCLRLYLTSINNIKNSDKNTYIWVAGIKSTCAMPRTLILLKVLVYKSSVGCLRLLAELRSKMAISFYLHLQVILDKVLYCHSIYWVCLRVHLLFQLSLTIFKIAVV